jgi:hypothetical protein
MGRKTITFRTSECGNSPEEAFYRARANAAVDYIGLWPSGTIADKSDFKLVSSLVDIDTELQSLTPADPACCISLGDGEYLFFGQALKQVDP